MLTVFFVVQSSFSGVGGWNSAYFLVPPYRASTRTRTDSRYSMLPCKLFQQSTLIVTCTVLAQGMRKNNARLSGNDATILVVIVLIVIVGIALQVHKPSLSPPSSHPSHPTYNSLPPPFPSLILSCSTASNACH